MELDSNDDNNTDNGAGDIESMRKELTEFGFKEEDLCKEEMSDLLKALRFSKNSATEEESGRSKCDAASTKDNSSSNAQCSSGLTRRYRGVADRRLPWCLLPPELTAAQKVSCLAAYLRAVAAGQHRRARGLSRFEVWPAAHRVLYTPTLGVCTRATRSGRSAPSYALDDDDSNEMDEFLPVKSKKRKVSSSETSASDLGIYTNKTFSLKRKSQKTECPKAEKECRVDSTAGEEEDDSANICRLIDSICDGDAPTVKDTQKTVWKQKKG